MSPQPMETDPTAPVYDVAESHQKRKRSVSMERAAYPIPRPKVAKSHHGSSGQIDYISRKYSDTLPLLSADVPIDAILGLIGDYEGVFQRHESFACNLGAKPLGPILMKRFERLFDGPPRILKTHGKEGTMVTWQDVVDFAEQKPEQFNLDKWRDGLRVCQIYTKQTRVEISEEDYLLIASKLPMKMMPTQPIAADEEKELGTVEIIEGKLTQIVALADQLEARARQLNGRIKLRKGAIIHKREQQHAIKMETYQEDSSPTSGNDRGFVSHTSNGNDRSGVSPTAGFVAVNSRPSPRVETSFYENGEKDLSGPPIKRTDQPAFDRHAVRTASSATKAELMKCFSTQLGQSSGNDADPLPKSSSLNSRTFWVSKTKGRPTSDADGISMLNHPGSPVPIPHTPSNLVHTVKPSPADRFEDSGPHKQEMLARMEQLNRGDRVMPPCDRCRRLHMDCLKNLTACQGCTKKHAKCSWKDVSDQELIDHPFVSRAERERQKGSPQDGDRSMSPNAAAMGAEDPLRPVRDEELLGEDASEESDSDSPSQIAHDEHLRDRPAITNTSTPIANSAAHAPRLHEATALIPSPAMTTTHGSSTPQAPMPGEPPSQTTASAAIQEASTQSIEDFSKVEERFFQQLNGSPFVKPLTESIAPIAPMASLHNAEKMMVDLQVPTPEIVSYDVPQAMALSNGHPQQMNVAETRLWNPTDLLASVSSESDTPSAERNGEKRLEQWSSINGNGYMPSLNRFQYPNGMND